jgi:ribokinase
VTAKLLLAAGYATIDVNARVGPIPASDGRVTAAAITRTFGGMAANCACAAAGPGTVVRMFGQTGGDPLGDEMVADLERHGVDTSGVIRTPSGTAICIIMIRPDGDRIIVSPPLTFDWSRVDAALLEGADALYLDGYRLTDGLPRASAARDKGILTAIDLDGLTSASGEELRAAAAAFSLILLNRATADLLGVEPGAAADMLVASGADIACVTLGAKGVVIAANGLPTTSIPGVPVDAVDTTGAGDVFAGVLLHEMLDGVPVVDAARRANLRAAQSTTTFGARELI